MRLMFFVSSLGSGGAERVVSTLANDFVSYGHDVQVTTLAPLSDDFYSLDRRVARVSLGRGMSGDSALGRFFNPIRRATRLRRELKRYRPEAVIAMVDVSNILLALASIGLRKRIVSIGSERSYPPLTEIGAHWAWLRKRTYGLLDGVVTQSEITSTWLQSQLGIGNTWVIPNPVSLPLDRREPVRDPELSRKGRKRVLAVGRYRVQKGFDLLIEGFASQQQFHGEWELVILGEGSERSRLEALIRDRGLEHRVTLAGVAGNVSDWYASADLFVLSSRFEGFPNVLLEAMAHGLPVIAFDCMTGPRELLEGGQHGILVPAEDVAALSSAMQTMFADASTRSDFAERAQQAARKYSVESVSAQWLELLQHLMRKKVA
jgi:glycosyltransferase involved in cell wall biosynthesis